MIRELTLSDAPTLTEIYNHYIRTSGATFEETEITQKEMKARIADIHFKQGFPYIVYENEGTLLGYAYATTFRERIAYRFTVESTVYVHPDHFGKGIGKSLYKELLKLIKMQGFQSVIGVITLPNEASVYLHEQLGFEKAGQFNKVGFKFNDWMDVGYWQLLF